MSSRKALALCLLGGVLLVGALLLARGGDPRQPAVGQRYVFGFDREHETVTEVVAVSGDAVRWRQRAYVRGQPLNGAGEEQEFSRTAEPLPVTAAQLQRGQTLTYQVTAGEVQVPFRARVAQGLVLAFVGDRLRFPGLLGCGTRPGLLRIIPSGGEDPWRPRRSLSCQQGLVGLDSAPPLTPGETAWLDLQLEPGQAGLFRVVVPEPVRVEAYDAASGAHLVGPAPALPLGPGRILLRVTHGGAERPGQPRSLGRLLERVGTLPLRLQVDGHTVSWSQLEVARPGLYRIRGLGGEPAVFRLGARRVHTWEEWTGEQRAVVGLLQAGAHVVELTQLPSALRLGPLRSERVEPRELGVGTRRSQPASAEVMQWFVFRPPAPGKLRVQVVNLGGSRVTVVLLGPNGEELADEYLGTVCLEPELGLGPYYLGFRPDLDSPEVELTLGEAPR